MVYQECPKPDEAVPAETSYLDEPDAGGDHYPNAVTFPSSGHMCVTVSPSGVEVKYVRSYLAGQGTNGTVDYSYTVSAPAATYDTTLDAGWNLVAGHTGTVFPSTLWGWTGSEYASMTAVSPWHGYWCKVEAQQAVPIFATSGPYTLTMTEGWNLIGNSMRVPATVSLPAGESAFAYDTAAGQYESVLVLPPGRGAWVKAGAGEELTLTPSQ
jgi:hypothetical protein